MIKTKTKTMLPKNIIEGEKVLGTNKHVYIIIDKDRVKDRLDGETKLHYVVKNVADGSLQLKPLYEIECVL